MALSTNTYTYAGGAQTFVVNFALGFIQRSDVTVRVNLAVDGSGDPVYSAFTWTDDSNIVVTPTLTIGDSVLLERTVSKTELKVNFAATSDVTPANLDLSAKHGLMLYQELVDGRVEGVESPIEAAERSVIQANAAAVSAAAALVSEGLADVDAIATAADVVSTSADVVSTAADAVATAADRAAINSGEVYVDRATAVAATVPAVVNRLSVLSPSGPALSYVRDAAGTALTTNSATVNWSPDGAASPQHFGAVLDGTTNDAVAVAAYLTFVGALGDPTNLSNASQVHPNVRTQQSVNLSSAAAAPIYRMENVAGVRLADSYVKATDAAFFCFNVLEGVSGFFLNNTRFETDGFAVLAKPSLSTSKNATSATNAASAVITSASHGFSVSDLVKAAYLTGGTWSTEGGNYFTVSAITTDTFTINLNSTGLGTLTGGNFVGAPVPADKGVISGNHVIGVDTTADVGISLDGDTRNVVAVGNLVENFQRTDNARPAHSIAVAGGDGDDIAYAKSENLMFLGNVANNIAGNAFHLEDACPLVSYSFNISDGVTSMVDIANDYVPTLGNYIGNHVSNFTEYAIFSAGTGSSSKMNFAFNLVDGSDTTQTTPFASRFNQLASENINHIGNIYYDLTNGGIEVSADGPTTHAYNVFDTLGGDAITGRSSTTSRAMLVESNNKFKSITGDIVDKTNSANIIGDRIEISPPMDASTADNYVYFVAQRAGWVTGVTRVLTSAGGSGSVNGEFFVEKITGTTAATILTNNVPRFGTEHDVFLWGSEHVTILVNEFAKGDILRVRNTGAADAVTTYAVQLEYFYYN